MEGNDGEPGGILQIVDALKLGHLCLALLAGLMKGEGRTDEFTFLGRTYQIEGITAANAVLIYPLDH